MTVVDPPSMLTLTEPVGTPPPGETGATVIVNVTASPSTDGLGTAVTVVVVLA